MEKIREDQQREISPLHPPKKSLEKSTPRSQLACQFFSGWESQWEDTGLGGQKLFVYFEHAFSHL